MRELALLAGSAYLALWGRCALRAAWAEVGRRREVRLLESWLRL